MVNNKCYRFCLMYEFVQASSHLIKQSFLYKNVTVCVKIYRTHQFSHSHGKKSYPLLYIHLYQRALYPLIKDIEKNHIFKCQEHFFQKTQNQNKLFAFTCIAFSHESQFRKKLDINRKHLLTQCQTVYILNKPLCPQIERAPPS